MSQNTKFAVIVPEDPALIKNEPVIKLRSPLVSTLKVTGNNITTTDQTSQNSLTSNPNNISATTTFNADKTLYVTNVSQNTSNQFFDINYSTSMFDKLAALTDATGVVNHDLSVSNVFYHTNILANFTVNVVNLDLSNLYSTNIVLICNQGAIAYIPNAFQIEGDVKTINWQAGVIPFGEPNKIDIVNFTVINFNGTYSVLGQVVSFG